MVGLILVKIYKHYTSQEVHFIQRCFQQYQMTHTPPICYQ